MLSITGFKSRNIDLTDSDKRIILAYSGGLDSSVLLNLLVSTIDHKRLLVWHVNHQLQDSALDMELFCESQSKQYQLNFKVSRLNLTHISNNIEAQAREARYNVFAKHINIDSDILLTAHHADDQLETILLNICRGTGVLGLRGIGREVVIKNMTSIRPLLSFSRSELESYAQKNNIDWIEDPTNVLDCYDRNFIRHDIAPSLKSRWPSVLGSFQQVSDNQKEAAECLAELAIMDYESCSRINTFIARTTLSINVLKLKTKVRQKNLLRFWLSQNAMSISSHQLNLVVKVISSYDHEFKKVLIKGGFLGLFGGELFCVFDGDIKSEAEIIAWLEVLDAHYVCRLNKDDLKISSHFLKRQFQSLKIPPWLRDQAIFYLSDNDSKHVIETIVL